ncbi:MAG: hypothetical protein HYR51_17525 [Candidatus Rokubacteria bacterium]|nr:hypothetical protein [Candidatus Rokubacteria bacterium]
MDEAFAGMPSSGPLWTEANEWALATAGSKAHVERDLRERHYQECLGLP